MDPQSFIPATEVTEEDKATLKLSYRGEVPVVMPSDGTLVPDKIALLNESGDVVAFYQVLHDGQQADMTEPRPRFTNVGYYLDVAKALAGER